MSSTVKSFRHLENNFDNDSAITLIDFRNELLTRGKGFSVQLGMIYKYNHSDLELATILLQLLRY